MSDNDLVTWWPKLPIRLEFDVPQIDDSEWDNIINLQQGSLTPFEGCEIFPEDLSGSNTDSKEADD